MTNEMLTGGARLAADQNLLLSVKSRTDAIYASVMWHRAGGVSAERIVADARIFATFIQQG